MLAHIGAFPNKCTIKHPFHNGYLKSLGIYENYITLFRLEKNKLFDNIMSHAWHITHSGWTCHVLSLGMHIYVMHRFMVQAFQDPPLCSSTGMKCLFSATNAIQSSTTVTTTIWGGLWVLWPAPPAKNPRRRASKTMVSLKGPSGQIRSAQEWYRWKYSGQEMTRFKGNVWPD